MRNELSPLEAELLAALKAMVGPCPPKSPPPSSAYGKALAAIARAALDKDPLPRPAPPPQAARAEREAD